MVEIYVNKTLVIVFSVVMIILIAFLMHRDIKKHIDKHE